MIPIWPGHQVVVGAYLLCLGACAALRNGLERVPNVYAKEMRRRTRFIFRPLAASAAVVDGRERGKNPRRRRRRADKAKVKIERIRSPGSGGRQFSSFLGLSEGIPGDWWWTSSR